ncbi:hypothetical protein ACOME3_010441 [Neoechinorhynchus agilis]
MRLLRLQINAQFSPKGDLYVASIFKHVLTLNWSIISQFIRKTNFFYSRIVLASSFENGCCDSLRSEIAYDQRSKMKLSSMRFDKLYSQKNNDQYVNSEIFEDSSEEQVFAPLTTATSQDVFNESVVLLHKSQQYEAYKQEK